MKKSRVVPDPIVDRVPIARQLTRESHQYIEVAAHTNSPDILAAYSVTIGHLRLDQAERAIAFAREILEERP